MGCLWESTCELGRDIALPIEACVMMLLSEGMKEEVGLAGQGRSTGPSSGPTLPRMPVLGCNPTISASGAKRRHGLLQLNWMPSLSDAHMDQALCYQPLCTPCSIALPPIKPCREPSIFARGRQRPVGRRAQWQVRRLVEKPGEATLQSRPVLPSSTPSSLGPASTSAAFLRAGL